MLHNPYPSQVDNVDKDALRFQTYLSGEDKALLMSIRPIKGTAQVVINHLIKHLCNDLRDLNITSYRPDADDILAVLVERRALTDDQIKRLRCTTVGASQQVPTWLQQHRRRPTLRQGPTSTSSTTKHPTKQAGRRKQPVAGETPAQGAEAEGRTNS